MTSNLLIGQREILNKQFRLINGMYNKVFPQKRSLDLPFNKPVDHLYSLLTYIRCVFNLLGLLLQLIDLTARNKGRSNNDPLYTEPLNQ